MLVDSVLSFCSLHPQPAREGIARPTTEQGGARVCVRVRVGVRVGWGAGG